MVVFLLLVAVGFVLLVFGADFLVDGACRVTARFGVPDRVAGLTIVATGTPEEVAQNPHSFTGQYLRPVLERAAELQSQK